MADTRYARIEPPYAAVVALDDRPIYVGPSLSAAAEQFTPGTAHGCGESEEEALARAREAARQQRETRRAAVRMVDED